MLDHSYSQSTSRIFRYLVSIRQARWRKIQRSRALSFGDCRGFRTYEAVFQDWLIAWVDGRYSSVVGLPGCLILQTTLKWRSLPGQQPSLTISTTGISTNPRHKSAPMKATISSTAKCTSPCVNNFLMVLQQARFPRRFSLRTYRFILKCRREPPAQRSWRCDWKHRWQCRVKLFADYFLSTNSARCL